MNDSFVEAIKNVVLSELDNVYTALPGKIEKYDIEKRRANVLPLIKYPLPNGDVISMPIITNVPVIQPSTQKAIISMPINKGDGCLLLFTSASIEKWLSSNIGQEVDPLDNRRFSLSDAVCILGLYPLTELEVSPISETALEIIYQDAYIQIEDDGAIKMDNGSGIIEMDNGGNVDINGGNLTIDV